MSEPLSTPEKFQITISIIATCVAFAALVATYHRYNDDVSKNSHVFYIWTAIICGALATLYVFLLPLIFLWVPIGLFVLSVFAQFTTDHFYF